jgi:hypothetical protein
VRHTGHRKWSGALVAKENSEGGPEDEARTRGL